MLERIVSFIERMVVALETIAKAPAVCAGNQTSPLTPTGLAHKVDLAAGLAHAEGKVERIQTTQMPPAPAPPQAQMPAPVPAAQIAAQDFLAQPAAIAPPTREVVGNKLIELATISRDEAVKVLDTFGGAKKLSDVAESDYLALLGTINKAIAATKAA